MKKFAQLKKKLYLCTMIATREYIQRKMDEAKTCKMYRIEDELLQSHLATAVSLA